MDHISLTGADVYLDCKASYDDPINELPRRCVACGFPDIDFVPQPYRIVRSRAMTPNETALAYLGNFLVRERVRRIIELIAPGSCDFYPTAFVKGDGGITVVPGGAEGKTSHREREGADRALPGLR